MLIQKGWDGVTTNHIAAAAGISPGSFYQYFSNKEQVLDTVAQRYLDAVEARVSQGFLQALAGPDAESVVRAAVGVLLDAFSEQPEMMRILALRPPSTYGDRRVAFAEKIDSIVATAMVARSPERVATAVASAWILVRCIEHVTTSYILERPQIAREVVIEELVVLITPYLDPAGRQG